MKAVARMSLIAIYARGSTVSWMLMLLFALLTPKTQLMGSENADFERYKSKLERVQQSIEKVKQHLSGARNKRGNVFTDLQQLESRISKNSKTLSKTEFDIDQQKQRITAMRSDLAETQQKLNAQKQRLADQFRSAYAIGHQQQLKMLLNQEDPAVIGRINVYFDYLNRARESQISAFLHSISEKQQLDDALQSTLREHERSLAERKKQENSLLSQRLKREQLLASLDRKIRNQEKHLNELEASRNRIENLLESLGELLADIPKSPSDSRPFQQQRGKLPWPASGPFLATYGEPRKQGGMKWKGVLINTKHGTPVRAVSRGRIAFADWLQGFGFIVIIDHGDGFMSLYGHNETLRKQAGDWVEAGEVVATSGDSGGQPFPGVYFEIRARGKPVDPSQWCSRAARFTTSLN